MAFKKILERTHLVLWFIVTILTGILAGFITSHSVMLGRYFTWLIESDNFHVFTDTFSAFRQATHANVHYNLFLYIHVLFGILWVIVCFIARKNRIISLTAGLSSFWIGSVFFGSGFSGFEEAVSTGVADAATQQSFVSLNVPLHVSFAALYSLSFILLLYSGIRTARKANRPAEVKQA